MVRNCSVGAVTSRTGRRVALPLGHVANLVVAVRVQDWIVVVELLLGLLGEESLEFRTKLVAARQIFVAPQ